MDYCGPSADKPRYPAHGSCPCGPRLRGNCGRPCCRRGSGCPSNFARVDPLDGGAARSQP